MIFGARASGGTFHLNGLTVTPEMHDFINHDLIYKSPKISIKKDGAALTAKYNKPFRPTYNLFIGAGVEYDMMECSARYYEQLANKRS